MLDMDVNMKGGEGTCIPLSYPNRNPPMQTTHPSQYARSLPSVEFFILPAGNSLKIQKIKKDRALP
jgi:hypothetical protein